MANTTFQKPSLADRLLGAIERIGNKLPDPAILFFISIVIVWILSALLAPVQFTEINPASGSPIRVNNLLTGAAMANFMANMVSVFVNFAPLGVVLVAMLGVGVADGSGFIHTGLKMMLNFTPKMLLTPMVIFVGIVSHSAIDAGYVLVIPLGGVIFLAAGRHPLAGIAAAFAGVSGGFGANPLPSALDPLLQGFTQPAAQIINPDVMVNPLCNYYFTASSTLLIVLLGWLITDRLIEPRLNKNTPVDAEAEQSADFGTITPTDRKAFWIASSVTLVLFALFMWVVTLDGSAFRDPNGELSTFAAPLMRSIVPIIFIFFLLPGLIHGLVSGKFKSTKNIIDQMAEAMRGMAYYVVMAFFCALFINAFATSNLGALLAIKGAYLLDQLNLSGPVTITGIIILVAFVNLFVGSASAKWALLAPILVPMMMQLGYSPELTQAAYRVGDSSTNIITPLMPYFPLIVVFGQKYVKSTGIGTLVSVMLPYSVTFIVLWTLYLVLFWMLGIPLGLQAGYIYAG
jgi:aminobenzoyl-glutamate transport protein